MRLGTCKNAGRSGFHGKEKWLQSGPGQASAPANSGRPYRPGHRACYTQPSPPPCPGAGRRPVGKGRGQGVGRWGGPVPLRAAACPLPRAGRREPRQPRLSSRRDAGEIRPSGAQPLRAGGRKVAGGGPPPRAALTPRRGAPGQQRKGKRAAWPGPAPAAPEERGPGCTAAVAGRAPSCPLASAATSWPPAAGTGGAPGRFNISINKNIKQVRKTLSSIKINLARKSYAENVSSRGGVGGGSSRNTEKKLFHFLWNDTCDAFNNKLHKTKHVNLSSILRFLFNFLFSFKNL